MEKIEKLKFEELEESVQEKLIEEEIQFKEDTFENEDITELVYDNFLKECEKRGFSVTEDDISWSGFNSQGDGASFTGYVYLDEFLEYKNITDLTKEEKEYLEDSDITIERSTHHYCHENTCYVSNNSYEELSERLEDLIEEERLELCKDLYKDLQYYHDSIFDYDNIKEDLIHSDNLYDKDGNQCNETKEENIGEK